MEDDDIVLEENEGLQEFLPQGFGKQSDKLNVSAQIETSKRHVPSSKTASSSQKQIREAAESGEGSDDDDDDDDDEDLEDDNPEDEYPISHELVIKTHEKPVTTLACDPSGSRLISGSTDCTIKLHDFASMTPTTIRAFKSVDPTATKSAAAQEVHPVHHVSFNPLHPSSVLVVSATSQAKIFSRDGDEKLRFMKGDMYIRDMHHTKGHVSEITSGAWCPMDANLLVTAGTDSTLRIWDINNHRGQRDIIVHKSKIAGSGGRTRMTAVAWSSPSQGGPNILVSAALNGSLVMYQGNAYNRPVGEVRDAHVSGTWTSSLALSPDGRTIVSLGGDDTVKLWDVRKFKAPLSTATHPSISSEYPTANISFSPTGTSLITGSATGHLHILNPATLRPEIPPTPVTPGKPLISVLWHDKLNQILCGSASAATHVLWRPGLSTAIKGAALVMGRAPKRRHIDDDPSLTTDLSAGINPDDIIVPGAASTNRSKPLTGLTASGKSRDPRRPAVPATTPFAKNTMDEERLRENVPLSSMRDEDPREALLRYAEKAEKEPLFTGAWRKTQPKTIFAELSDDEDESARKKKRIKG